MDEARYAIMLLKHRYDGPRRHGKHCFCAECLQDEINAKDDRIEQLEAELAEVRKDSARLDWLFKVGDAAQHSRAAIDAAMKECHNL